MSQTSVSISSQPSAIARSNDAGVFSVS
jgi:hypothetical protein